MNLIFLLIGFYIYLLNLPIQVSGWAYIHTVRGGGGGGGGGGAFFFRWTVKLFQKNCLVHSRKLSKQNKSYETQHKSYSQVTQIVIITCKSQLLHETD